MVYFSIFLKYYLNKAMENRKSNMLLKLLWRMCVYIFYMRKKWEVLGKTIVRHSSIKRYFKNLS